MKRNNMDLGQILLIVGGVIIAMVIILWALNSNGVLKKSGNDTIGQAAELFAGYSDEAVAKYDGCVVGGDEVLDALDKYCAAGSTAEIIIITKANAAAGTSKTYKVGATYTAPANTSNDYINPNGVFEGKVKLNSNNILESITFTQK